MVTFHHLLDPGVSSEPDQGDGEIAQGGQGVGDAAEPGVVGVLTEQDVTDPVGRVGRMARCLLGRSISMRPPSEPDMIVS